MISQSYDKERQIAAVLLAQALSIIALELWSLIVDHPLLVNRRTTSMVNFTLGLLIPLWLVYHLSRDTQSKRWLQRWAGMCIVYVILLLTSQITTLPEFGVWMNAGTVGLILLVLLASGFILKQTGISGWSWSMAEFFLIVIIPGSGFSLAWFGQNFAYSIQGSPIHLTVTFFSPLATSLPFLILVAFIMAWYEERM